MKKSKEYSEDEYKDATEFEDEEETMDDMTILLSVIKFQMP